MKKAIIIPVYLRLERPEDLSVSEGMVLTRRAVQSLRVLTDSDFDLILPVCFSFPEMSQDFLIKAEKAFRDEMKLCRPKGTIVFSPSQLEAFRKWAEPRTKPDFTSLIGLEGYSRIRNTGLLVAQALSVDMVVFIDNDEVIEAPDYLDTASEFLTERWNDQWVSGKGGFYLNADGSIFLPPQRSWWNIFWDKTKWMNETYKRILSSKERLVPAPMLLGGNLVLHQRVFQEVPFDPFIPRGEDTDYLINASKLGFSLLFDRKLRVRHLHPKRTETYYHQELKGDIERFLYERQKIKEGPLIDLNPYPGHFLKRTLYFKAFLTASLLCLHYLARGQGRKAKQTLTTLPLFARSKKGGWSPYLRFQRDWQRVMKTVKEEGMGFLFEEADGGI
jgi:glycosyltransferase involved in cell wall biosynthesis